MHAALLCADSTINWDSNLIKGNQSLALQILMPISFVTALVERVAAALV